MSNLNNTTVSSKSLVAFTLSTVGGSLLADLGVRNESGKISARTLNEGAGFGASRGMLNAVRDLSLGMYPEITGSWLFMKFTAEWLNTQPALKSVAGHGIGCDEFRTWVSLNTSYSLPIVAGEVYDLKWDGFKFQVFHIVTPAPWVEGEEDHESKQVARNTIHKTKGLSLVVRSILAGSNFRILATRELQDKVLLSDGYQSFIAAHNDSDEAALIAMKSDRKAFNRDMAANSRGKAVSRKNDGGANMTERTAEYISNGVEVVAVGAEEATTMDYTKLIGMTFVMKTSKGRPFMNGYQFVGSVDNALSLAVTAKSQGLTIVEVAGE